LIQNLKEGIIIVGIEDLMKVHFSN